MSKKRQDGNAQKRHWVHTIWPGHCGLEDDCDDEDFIQAVHEVTDAVRSDGRLRYMTGQVEHGDQGEIHAQIYTEWTVSLRRAQVCKALPSHAEYRTGTRQQAREYCRKKEGRVEAFPDHGEWRPERGDDDFGQREGPKARALKMVLEGKDPIQIAEEDPEAFFTFHRSIVSLYGALECAKERGISKSIQPIAADEGQQTLSAFGPRPDLGEEE